MVKQIATNNKDTRAFGNILVLFLFLVRKFILRLRYYSIYSFDAQAIGAQTSIKINNRLGGNNFFRLIKSNS